MSKLKILFFAADPHSSHGNARRLRLDEEARQIFRQVRTARYRDAMEFDFRWAARKDDLLEALDEAHPQVLHFSGHSEHHGIVLVDDDGRRPYSVDGDALAKLLLPFRMDLRVVMLSACYSLVHAEAIASIVDCAIGTHTKISDKAAIVFNAAFYGAVASGDSVLAAFERARAVLKLRRFNEEEYPELAVRSGVDPAQLVLISSHETATGRPAAPQMVLSPTVFSVPPIPRDPGLVVAMMPFSRNFTKTYLQIRTACEAVGLRCERADTTLEGSTDIQDVFDLIYRSASVVVDLSGRKPNVMYACGIAHTLGRPVLPISRGTEAPPFELAPHSVLTYLPNAEGFAVLREMLESRLRSMIGPVPSKPGSGRGSMCSESPPAFGLSRFMERGVSIHIGVNQPAWVKGQPWLSLNEETARKMAELAYQAGYRAIHVLCGADATRDAVGAQLTAAAHAIRPGQTLFVSFFATARAYSTSTSTTSGTGMTRRGACTTPT